ncbi:tRNA (guanine-N(7)-)-methyltransferase (tRNA(m7G46)-methyltransferase) [Coemansia sp. S155-1]|nr:tRNA (guanine-N(7)-)-methyltransferase (tRNA(m7G46)-methyltransferase) [Coemansia sp. S155-1]
MYAEVVAGLRVALGYLFLAPFVFGALVTTLLATNVLVSYWFQRRRERKLKKTEGNGRRPRGELPLEPPVQRIPRLLFASLVTGKDAPGVSLFPTEFNNEKWEQPRISLGGDYEQLESELASLLGLVVRDFVQDWFRDLSADSSFPRCVFTQIGQTLESVAERVRGKIDMSEFVVGQILPVVTAHIRAIREVQDVSEEPLSPGGSLAPADNVHRRRVEQSYAAMPGAKWHLALHSLRSSDDEADDQAKLTEKKLVMAHIRRVVDLILPLVLGPDKSSFAAHRVLVRELLNGALLAPLVLSIAEPDTINQLLDGQLEKLIREQHMVNELRDALDRQARGIPEDEDVTLPLDETEELDEGDLAMGDPSNVRTYEQFMSTIDECSDSLELARIREDILAQIRKRRILIMGQSKDDIVHGQRVRDIIVYINRLYVAKKKAERRLESLREEQTTSRRRGNSASSVISPFSTVDSRVPVTARQGKVPMANNLSRASTYYEHRDDPSKLGPPQFTLHEILTNVSSLSAFAEYMDLIGHRFILEFWVNVEGVRQASIAEMLPSVLGSLWKTYFTLRVDELAALGSDVEAAVSHVQRCLKPYRLKASLELDAEKMTEAVCAEAFDLICLVQASVFRHMEQAEFPPFLRSALYTRFLKEYYVTPRQDHLEASLFAAPDSRRLSLPRIRRPSSVARSEPDSGQPAPRKLSLVRTVAESISRRSVSAESSCSAPPATTPSKSLPKPKPQTRAWTFAGMRGRPEAPLVSTDTSEARGTQVLTHSEPVPEPVPEPVVQRRRSVRVGRSEVRRLSASLRSIGLGEPSSDTLQLEPIEATDSESDRSDEVESSGDEAEALVIGRAVVTPSPGDLFLDERLSLVERTVSRTTHQMAIVRALMRQAASRHRAHEQRVLRASYRDLRREALAGAEQQRVYERCALDHVLTPHRTRVHIPRAIAAEGEEGHVVYLIEMQQSLPPEHAAPGSRHAPTGWVVARRYREFFALHRDLKAQSPDIMRSHDLPARTPGILLRSLQNRDVDTRRRGLETYIQGLLRDPRVCGSRALRLFLSSAEPPAPGLESQGEGGGWMQRIYKTVGEDIGGITGADSMLEIIVQELGAQVAMQQPVVAVGAEATAFIDPLSDLFVEVFGLKNRRNWLRRQAISILLRHIVGGTVERRIRDIVTSVLADSQLTGLLANLRNTLWPLVAGVPMKFQGFKHRSAEQIADTEKRARAQVLWYVPRVLAGMVGRKNSRDGAALLIDAVQYRRPNLSLMLTVFDSVIVAVFPEVKYQMEHFG